MSNPSFKYIFGPVSSWRLGSSLGIDPISADGKVCNFDCVYCQLGKTKVLDNVRRVYVSAGDIIKEISSLPDVKIDYYTFSACGEPTLASNLGEIIHSLRDVRPGKIAVITNGALIGKEDVRRDLSLADYVMIKLDASNQELLNSINSPVEGVDLKMIVEGIKEFKKMFKGRLSLQVMFFKENIKFVDEIANIVKQIGPDEVQINTPLRKCDVEPLSDEDLNDLKCFFDGVKTITAYESMNKKVDPIDSDSTFKRHGVVT